MKYNNDTLLHFEQAVVSSLQELFPGLAHCCWFGDAGTPHWVESTSFST